MITKEEQFFLPDVKMGSTNLVEFTYEELSSYTQGFDEKNIIGKGGHGTVYKGLIQEHKDINLMGQCVAIKMNSSGRIRDKEDWEAEISFLPKLNHPHIIKLIGYCQHSPKLCLVYPLMNLGSISSNLSELKWANTIKILRGAALALRFMHNQSPPLIFRDFKAANILLDENYSPKLCDFGTVRPEGEILGAGTFGSTDPEIFNSGIGSTQTDVYSMGTLIFQMIMKKKKAADPMAGKNILDWATEIDPEERDVVHYMLKSTGCNTKTAREITKLAFRCVDVDSTKRPTMNQVLQIIAKLDTKKHFYICPSCFKS